MTLGLLAAFTAMFVSTIGFAIWERRSMLQPLESRMAHIDAALADEQRKLGTAFEVFRALAESDRRIAELLRKLGLLWRASAGRGRRTVRPRGPSACRPTSGSETS